MFLFSNKFFENLDQFFNLELPEVEGSSQTVVDLEDGRQMTVTEESGPGFTRVVKTIEPRRLTTSEQNTEYVNQLDELSEKIGATEYDMKKAGADQEYEVALKLQKELRELQGSHAELEAEYVAWAQEPDTTA